MATLTRVRETFQGELEVVRALLDLIEHGNLKLEGPRLTGAQLQGRLAGRARFAKQGTVSDLLSRVDVVPNSSNRFQPYQVLDAAQSLHILRRKLERELAAA